MFTKDCETHTSTADKGHNSHGTQGCQLAPRCCHQDPPTPSTSQGTQPCLQAISLNSWRINMNDQLTLSETLADDGLNLIFLSLRHDQLFLSLKTPQVLMSLGVGLSSSRIKTCRASAIDVRIFVRWGMRED